MNSDPQDSVTSAWETFRTEIPVEVFVRNHNIVNAEFVDRLAATKYTPDRAEYIFNTRVCILNNSDKVRLMELIINSFPNKDDNDSSK